MAKRSITSELSSQEEATLKMRDSGHKTQQHYSRRSQGTLLSAKGLTLKEIIAGSGLTETNCLKWRKRFLTGLLEDLRDMQRKDRPPSIIPWQRA